MKKILVIAILVVYSTTYAQKTKLKANTIKNKYENVFYKSPKKYNNQALPFIVSSVVFSSSYKGSKSKHTYQISVSGKVNNNQERVLYNAQSVEELAYYKAIFNGRYKKIILFENDYYVSSKKHFDTAISVEF